MDYTNKTLRSKGAILFGSCGETGFVYLASKVFVFIAISLALPFAVERGADRFHVASLMHAEGESALPLFSLPSSFVYLGRGSQCYVFQRGDLILKLFYRGKPGRFERAVQGAKLAWERLREETGLLYLHLGNTTGIGTVWLWDRLGRPHLVSLDSTSYVIQKRGDSFLSYIEKHPDELPSLLESFQDFVQLRTSRHVANSDTAFPANVALLEGRLVEIDFGEYWDLSGFGKEEEEKERVRFSSKVNRWLSQSIRNHLPNQSKRHSTPKGRKSSH